MYIIYFVTLLCVIYTNISILLCEMSKMDVKFFFKSQMRKWKLDIYKCPFSENPFDF